jgi:hypothetical protein
MLYLLGSRVAFPTDDRRKALLREALPTLLGERARKQREGLKVASDDAMEQAEGGHGDLLTNEVVKIQRQGRKG